MANLRQAGLGNGEKTSNQIRSLVAMKKPYISHLHQDKEFVTITEEHWNGSRQVSVIPTIDGRWKVVCLFIYSNVSPSKGSWERLYFSREEAARYAVQVLTV